MNKLSQQNAYQLHDVYLQKVSGKCEGNPARIAWVIKDHCHRPYSEPLQKNKTGLTTLNESITID